MKKYKVYQYMVVVPGVYEDYDAWDYLDLARANMDKATVYDSIICYADEVDRYTDVHNLEVEVDDGMTTIYWYDDEEVIPPSEAEREADAMNEAADRWYDEYREKRDGTW